MPVLADTRQQIAAVQTLDDSSAFGDGVTLTRYENEIAEAMIQEALVGTKFEAGIDKFLDAIGISTERDESPPLLTADEAEAYAASVLPGVGGAAMRVQEQVRSIAELKNTFLANPVAPEAVAAIPEQQTEAIDLKDAQFGAGQRMAIEIFSGVPHLDSEVGNGPATVGIAADQFLGASMPSPKALMNLGDDYAPDTLATIGNG